MGALPYSSSKVNNFAENKFNSFRYGSVKDTNKRIDQNKTLFSKILPAALFTFYSIDNNLLHQLFTNNVH